MDCVYMSRALYWDGTRPDGHFEVPEGYEFKSFVEIKNGVVTFIACRAEDPGHMDLGSGPQEEG